MTPSAALYPGAVRSRADPTAATPLGSLTLAEAPLIDAENLFRQPGPPLNDVSISLED